MHKTSIQTKFFFIVALLVHFQAFGQVQDDFSDGNFTTNPAWTGETSLWTVSNGELRSNGFGTDDIHLSTPSSRIDDTEWRFKMRYDGGAPSSGNSIRVYLISDQADLEASLNGYFVQVGESGSDDSYDLYRMDAVGNSVKLIDGQDGLGGTAVDATIKVIRDNMGNWELFVDQGNLGIFASQGTANDNTHPTTAHFGFVVSHTSTRVQSFFFDDVYVGDLIQDLTPPELLSLNVVDANSIELNFNEALDQASAQTNSNYSIDNGIGNPASATLDGNDPRKLTLNLGSPLQNNTNYTLTINNLEDLAGNLLAAPITRSFSYFVPDNAVFKDVIINEIMADPTPSVGLPSVEYLELYNRGTGTYDLEDWTIDNGTTTGSLPSFLLQPGQYVILVSSGDEAQFQSFGDVIAPSSWISLVNGGDNLGLRSNAGELIDSVDYDLAWYRDGVKDNGGYSLELINPNQLDCAPLTNWTAAVSTQGGTPGGQNSVFSTTPDQIAPKILSANVLGSDTIELCFNEGMNPATLDVLASYSLDNGLGIPQAALPVGPDFQCVKLAFAGPIQVGLPYNLEVKDVEDCAGNPIATANTPVAKGVLPLAGDLIITELLPDFEPQRSLPLSEFVEIHNRSSSVLDLNGYGISDGTTTADLPNSVIYPGEYVIICSIFDTADWNNFGRVIPVDALPSLNNSSDSIRLLGPFLETLDYVFYENTWYRNAEKAQGGWTLERIDNDLLDCNSPENWVASLDTRGGSPGQENSAKGVFQDNVAPVLSTVNIVGAEQILLTFSEPMDPAGLTQESNFQLDQGIGQVLRAIIASADNRAVRLDLASPLQPNTLYQLSINNLSDCIGNAFQEAVRLGLPQNAEAFDVIFTELFPDFGPARGLPETEFVELYNRSSKIISLASLTLEVSGTRRNLPQGLLFPGEYTILTNKEDEPLFRSYGNVLPVDGLPSLTNGVDSLYLYGPDQTGAEQLIDMTYYEDDWYGNQEASEGGYSLERIDRDFVGCVNRDNWSASKAQGGGTPGTANSIDGAFSDATAPLVSALLPLSANQVRIVFSEQMDLAGLEEPESYSVEPNLGNPLLVMRREPFTSEVILTFDSDMAKNTIYTLSFLNLKDCSGNLLLEEIQFGLPEEMEAGDILINEILFNPKTGGSDFVEVINVSSKILDLSEMSLGEIFPETDSIFNSDQIAESISLILPGQIVCLTRDMAFQRQQYQPPSTANFLEMSSFPSYDDAKGECVVYRTNDELVLDRFAYLDDYHYLTLADDDGVSLERLSLDQPTNAPSNWQSAASTVGFATPGYENSQYIPASNEVTEVTLENPTFSPNLDGVDDVLAIRYKLDFPGANIRVQILDANGRLVRILQQNTLLNPDGGVVFWDGFKDDKQRAPIGMYVVLVEVLNADTGEKKGYKRVAVLADNF